MSTILGEFLGYLIVTLYTLTILNYFIKVANRRAKKQLQKNKVLNSGFLFLKKFIVGNHRYFGIIIILILLAHAANQFNIYGISPTGSFAALILIAQVSLGFYGYKSKSKGKLWLKFHRGIAALLFFAILIHVV